MILERGNRHDSLLAFQDLGGPLDSLFLEFGFVISHPFLPLLPQFSIG
jgi:hypothetical protein